MDLVPAVATVISFASVALFLKVGHTVQHRPVSPEAHSARTAFVLWWYGLAGVSLAGALLSGSGLPVGLGLFLAANVVLIAAICTALAGLLHYLVFLYTSSTRPLPYIVGGYVATFALLVAFIFLQGPDAITSGRFGNRVHYATPITSGPLYWAVIILIIVPPLVAALAYFSLYWRTRDAVLKRRILMVSLSLVFWFGSSFVGIGQGPDPAAWWVITSRLIALAAATTILYAYVGLRPATPAGSGRREPPQEPIYEDPTRKVASTLPVASLL